MLGLRRLLARTRVAKRTCPGVSSWVSPGKPEQPPLPGPAARCPVPWTSWKRRRRSPHLRRPARGRIRLLAVSLVGGFPYLVVPYWLSFPILWVSLLLSLLLFPYPYCFPYWLFPYCSLWLLLLFPHYCPFGCFPVVPLLGFFPICSCPYLVVSLFGGFPICFSHGCSPGWLLVVFLLVVFLVGYFATRLFPYLVIWLVPFLAISCLFFFGGGLNFYFRPSSAVGSLAREWWEFPVRRRSTSRARQPSWAGSLRRGANCYPGIFSRTCGGTNLNSVGRGPGG